jgi:hypothetical protein
MCVVKWKSIHLFSLQLKYTCFKRFVPMILVALLYFELLQNSERPFAPWGCVVTRNYLRASSCKIPNMCLMRGVLTGSLLLVLLFNSASLHRTLCTHHLLIDNVIN